MGFQEPTEKIRINKREMYYFYCLLSKVVRPRRLEDVGPLASAGGVFPYLMIGLIQMDGRIT